MTRFWPAFETDNGVVKTGSPGVDVFILWAPAWRVQRHTNTKSALYLVVLNKRSGNNNVKEVKILFISCWFEVFRISLPGFDVGRRPGPKIGLVL